MKKWGFLRKMVAVDWLFMGMEALEGYWFPKQRILSSISESKREDHQCVRKQMTELVVICKPPQYRRGPAPKVGPSPPTEESSQTNHSQQPNKTGTAFPHQQAQGTSAKNVVDKILPLNQMHTLTFFSLLLLPSSLLPSLRFSFVKMYHWSLTVYFKW